MKYLLLLFLLSSNIYCQKKGNCYYYLRHPGDGSLTVQGVHKCLNPVSREKARKDASPTSCACDEIVEYESAKNTSNYRFSSQSLKTSNSYNTINPNESRTTKQNAALTESLRQAQQQMNMYKESERQRNLEWERTKAEYARTEAIGEAVYEGAVLVKGIIDDFAAAKRERLEREAQAEAARKREEDEIKRREAAKANFYAQFKGNDWPKDKQGNSAYFFIITKGDDEANISEIFEVSRKSSGSWPYESDVKNKISNEIGSNNQLVGYFDSYQSAISMRNQVMEFAKNSYLGVEDFKISSSFANTKNTSSNSNSSDVDNVWGANSSKSNKQKPVKQSSSEFDDVWATTDNIKTKSKPVSKSKDGFEDVWASTGKTKSEPKQVNKSKDDFDDVFNDDLDYVWEEEDKPTDEKFEEAAIQFAKKLDNYKKNRNVEYLGGKTLEEVTGGLVEFLTAFPITALLEDGEIGTHWGQYKDVHEKVMMNTKILEAHYTQLGLMNSKNEFTSSFYEIKSKDKLIASIEYAKKDLKNDLKLLYFATEGLKIENSSERDVHKRTAIVKYTEGLATNVEGLILINYLDGKEKSNSQNVKINID